MLTLSELSLPKWAVVNWKSTRGSSVQTYKDSDMERGSWVCFSALGTARAMLIRTLCVRFPQIPSWARGKALVLPRTARETTAQGRGWPVPKDCFQWFLLLWFVLTEPRVTSTLQHLNWRLPRLISYITNIKTPHWDTTKHLDSVKEGQRAKASSIANLCICSDLKGFELLPGCERLKRRNVLKVPFERWITSTTSQITRVTILNGDFIFILFRL